MQVPVRVGVIGCGNIFGRYATGMSRFPGLTAVAVADADPARAQAAAASAGVVACPVDELLARPDIDVVVNITPPTVHASVSEQVLAAGKHLYTEKPLADTVAAARAGLAEAGRRGLLFGAAPDTFIWAVPVIGLLVTSFRTTGDVATSGWWTAFTHPAFTPENYGNAATLIDLAAAAGNSLSIAVPATVGTVTVSAAAAYALARMPFRGRLPILLLVIALQVTPPQLTLVPVLRLFNTIGLTGSTPAVWLYQVGFTLPFGVFLLHGFFASVPAELLEAAAIDGAGEFTIFRRIVLPTATPVLAALAMLQFIWSWNDLLTPLLFLGGGSADAPFTVQIAGLLQTTGQGQETLAAAALLSVLLPLAVLPLLQRYFIRGILGGAVKG
ncbi:Gfo/Idh/MocA family oxidoreductase [Streptomyces sp. NPDC058457]|uniref:Gfo/Idh/MocA family oxidoreductase n=1 Tax=Streptomyces sp. NPDC058457 TaxID=3346507 RepID=UPI003668B1E1